MKEVIFILGIILITSGVAFIYWQAALIFLGLVLVLIALFIARYSHPSVKAVSSDKPDADNN